MFDKPSLQLALNFNRYYFNHQIPRCSELNWFWSFLNWSFEILYVVWNCSWVTNADLIIKDVSLHSVLQVLECLTIQKVDMEGDKHQREHITVGGFSRLLRTTIDFLFVAQKWIFLKLKVAFNPSVFSSYSPKTTRWNQPWYLSISPFPTDKLSSLKWRLCLVWQHSANWIICFDIDFLLDLRRNQI